MKKFILACIWLLLAVTSCQRPAPKEEELAPPPVSFGSEMKNPYGSFFAGERVKDTFVENVGYVSSYRFVARNFRPDQRLTLYSQNLGGALKPICRYEVDDDGQLGKQLGNGTMMLDNEVYLMFDYFKGEPVQFWLCSFDGKAKLSTTFVPYPIRAEAKDGAEVSVRRLTPDARLILCEGTDFNPDEEILVSSQAGPKRTQNVPVICTNGRFSMVFEPASPGKSGGTAFIDIQRMGERLHLDYDWGCEALNAKRRMGSTAKIQPDALLKLPTDLDMPK